MWRGLRARLGISKTEVLIAAIVFFVGFAWQFVWNVVKGMMQ